MIKDDQPSISDLLSVGTNLLIEFGYIYKDKNQPLVAFICSCFYSINQIWSEAFKEDSVFNSAQILVKLNYNFDQYLLVMLNSCVLPMIKDLNRDFGLLISTPGEDLITLSCPQGSRLITCPSPLGKKIPFILKPFFFVSLLPKKEGSIPAPSLSGGNKTPFS